MELRFLDYEFGDPKFSEEECRSSDRTFVRPLHVNVELLIKETGEIQRQRVYMGDYPWMTDQGTFIINGAERVVVSQLVRSPGVYYSSVEDPASGRTLYWAKVIPNRGAWLEFETSNKDLLSVKVDRKRKIAATTLLRAIGYESNDEIAGLFATVDTNPEHQYIASTLDKDLTKTVSEALIEVYKKLRPGDPPTGENARQLVDSLFFNFRRYDLGPRRPLQVRQAAGPHGRADGHRAPARRGGHRRVRADDHPRGHRRDRRPPHRAQQRPRSGRTTSTTSATAASARTASSSRTPSASASSGWSASSASA